MSKWTPKVGDKVMVGEHGPYRVDATHADKSSTILVSGEESWVPNAWLTPAPEPEPDEPTAPGALVRDGVGRYLTRGGMAAGRWYGPNVQGYTWAYIERPVTVVLADPAEVEQLRAEVGVLREQSDSFLTQRDELQRRIDKVLSKDREWGGVLYEAIRQILRGES